MKYFTSPLILLICLASVQWTPSNAEGLTLFPMDTVQKKLYQITDRILSWSPFAANKKGGSKSSDELELDFSNIMNTNLTVRRHYFYGCECRNFFCSCCAHIEVTKTTLNHTGCLNMTYENLYQLSVRFDLNERIFYNNTISIVKQPEEMCASYNTLNTTKLCLKFYRLDARNHSLAGSVDLIVKDTMENTNMSRIKLGSFRFGNGTQYYEKNLMKIYLNRKPLESAAANRTNASSFSSLDHFYESYDNFINKLNYFPLPKFSFNFQPDRLIDNLYNSLFTARILKKQKNNTDENVTPSMESREADFNEKRGYYRISEQP